MSSTIIDQFKKVYISVENCNYVYDIVVEKMLWMHPRLFAVLSAEMIQKALLQIQHIIFDNALQKINGVMQNNSSVNLQELLLQMNNLTIKQLEYAIEQNMVNGVANDVSNEGNVVPNRITNELIDETSNVVDWSTARGIDIGVQTDTQFDQKQQITWAQESKDAKSSTIDESYNMSTNSDTKDIFLLELNSMYSDFNNGRYTFKLIENVCLKSFRLNAISLECSFYNIYDKCNTFYIYENGVKNEIKIATGYYSIKELLIAITDTLNKTSTTKTSYKVHRNTIKNRVFITSDKNFKLHFPCEELRSMLGFQRAEYMNNNTYVAESCPNTTFLDDIYIKIYLNEDIIPQYTCNSNSWMYFEKLTIDYTNYFGKNYNRQSLDSTSTFLTDTSADEISIEFWDARHMLVEGFTKFSLTCEVGSDINHT